jgi:hypothetical protein
MPNTKSAGRGELSHRGHHRKLGEGAAAQIVAVSEASRQNDGIHITETMRIVPDEFRFLPQIVADGVECVVVAIASGEKQ